MHTRTGFPTSPSAGASYGFYCTLGKTAFADTAVRVTDVLKTESFGVLTDIDMLLPAHGKTAKH